MSLPLSKAAAESSVDGVRTFSSAGKFISFSSFFIPNILSDASEEITGSWLWFFWHGCFEWAAVSGYYNWLSSASFINWFSDFFGLFSVLISFP